MVPPEQMRRVVICSGAIYYHLNNARRQRKITDIALVRLEQLAPFPHDLLVEVMCHTRISVPQMNTPDVVVSETEWPKHCGPAHWLSECKYGICFTRKDVCWKQRTAEGDLPY